MFMVFIFFCDTLLLWKPIKPDILMKLAILGSYLSYHKGCWISTIHLDLIIACYVG